MSRVKREIDNAALRDDLIELIETVIIYKLTHLSREEIQAMLQVKDIRESRVYREAKEEGYHEGIARSIVKLAAKKMPPEEIASSLEVEFDLVREVLKGQANG